MKPSKLYNVIKTLHLSEKAMLAEGETRQYVFKVAKWANKLDIKEAVEKLFNVSVDKIRVVNLKGKVKRFKFKPGQRDDVKKAYVTLNQGQEIDFADTGIGL